MTSEYLLRFGGIGRLYGKDGLQRLQAAHVCVIGIGGVGSWAAEALARSGIGELTLMDLDDICVTNSNRQVHTLNSTVGQMKTEAVAKRIAGINPECQVHVCNEFVTRNNVAELIDQRFDYVIDCIDSVKNKAALLAHCKRQKIRVVTTGAAGGQIDPTQIAVADLNKTHNDPLAKKTRSLLRREYGFSRNPSRNYSIPCVYSTEQLRYPQADGSVCQTKQFDGDSTRLDCASGFGAATMVTGTFGFVAAARVVERLAIGQSKKS
ncbi:tRNA cyclic N6-threonylcarbamoyladenosine(37) synthase TcdA [Bacterioplanes sanyensis]|uniref:tRNA threonylcarbamoyladenosine dehydratase n=1 Tax=Bacterioplanes sanyensis TaxID=1249553 RepID=A0A222FNS2_9GAMM|nr:tRNA cyclic N6-threonylcarbamoyladenosine(37) synthase TcdA [Bacterioplanes sanyensis]ASP40186.1 tRNA cyclic N6-threonylcarbamoyladenosine(37) synthase TcdA [Bacterioplanes sanyensis]